MHLPPLRVRAVISAPLARSQRRACSSHGGGYKVGGRPTSVLYVGTPWEAKVVADRRDLDEFNEASRTIGRVLSVRALVDLLRFILWVCECREV
jgi:hypothetical protein